MFSGVFQAENPKSCFCWQLVRQAFIQTQMTN